MSQLRRNFLKTSVGTAATAEYLATAAQAPAGGRKMIGIQVGAVSFLDEGVESVLDIFQDKGHINTLFVATFTYGRGIAGRQVPGRRFPITASRNTIRGSGAAATRGRKKDATRKNGWSLP